MYGKLRKYIMRKYLKDAKEMSLKIRKFPGSYGICKQLKIYINTF